MITYEICFDDLNENAQKELLDLLKLDGPEDMNWDNRIVPLAILDFEEELIEDNEK